MAPTKLKPVQPANKSATLLAAAVFAASAALYIHTAAPTLGGAFDSEEFQHVAYTLGIAHATGYPLYLILGKVFTTLAPLGNVAYRMNLLSALIGAGTVLLVFLNSMQLTRRPLASLAAAALFATNAAVWRQAGVASVGPLHLFLVAAILYALLRWYAKARAGPSPAPTIAAFLFGLSLTHHRSTLLLAPAIALFVFLVDSNLLRRPRDWARIAFSLLAPLLLYLYLPLFGHNSPWYSNTLEGFLAQVSGGDAGDFIRAAPSQVAEGIILVSQYLFDSFGYVGLAVVIVGAISSARRSLRGQVVPVTLFLGLCTLIFSVWGTIYAGEPDRYLVLPFVFLIYWFALGVAALENLAAQLPYSHTPTLFRSHTPILARASLVVILALSLLLPFGDRYRVADWSSFDRVYKQWDEIFSLPLPRDAVLVGNWGQLNAMRYIQRVENRRPDLQFVGTLYDPAPQTQAARAALANDQALFLAPGIPLPTGNYRYGQLGPLLQVRDRPQTASPISALNSVRVNESLSLANIEVTTALEPYAPTRAIAPNRTARIALTWRADQAVKNFIVRIGLYDPEGRLAAQRDEPPVRGLYPTSQWQRGEYVSDVHNLLIPAGSPPGQYTWRVGLVDAEAKTPTSENVVSGSLIIDRVTNLTRDQVFIQHPLDNALGNRLALWGYGGLDGIHRAGQKIGIYLLWAVRETIGEDVPIQFALLDAAGKTVKTWQRAAIDFYPTREWQRGELLKAYYDLELPDTPGEFTFAVGLDGQPVAPIATLQVAP
ncbi:MAG: DUF2723 domain-containing protein [Chloroflexi bacterium]|nr:DUF2723 domain-containing protein [Chloroflexota bacterium]